MEKSLTIVIPAYNEEKSIGDVIRSIKVACSDIVSEIIVVDDGSTDQTARVAHDAGAHVLKHRQNCGYGSSLKSGIIASKTGYVMTMDADGQHDAKDVRRLWERAVDNDMVVGARQGFMHGVVWRMPGKWLLWGLAKYLVQKNIEDLNSGLRVFERNVVLKYMHICPPGFSFSTTITMVMFSRGYKVEYVPIKVAKRIGKSTVKLSTGFETLLLMLRIATLFNPLRLFLPASIFAIFVSLAWGIPKLYLVGEGVSVGSMLGIVTGLLMFSLGLISDQVSQLRLERFETANLSTLVDSELKNLDGDL